MLLRRTIDGWYALEDLRKESRASDPWDQVTTTVCTIGRQDLPCVPHSQALTLLRTATVDQDRSRVFSNRIRNDSRYVLRQLIPLSSAKVKARCWLDSHRGCSTASLGDSDWEREAKNYSPAGTVLDMNWYTGVMPQLWHTVKDIPTEHLYLWLFLLTQTMPVIDPDRQISERACIVRCGESLSALSDLGLVALDEKGTILRVNWQPCHPPQGRTIRIVRDGTPVTLMPGDVSRFCRDNGLSRGGILRVANGWQQQYKGWRLAS